MRRDSMETPHQALLGRSCIRHRSPRHEVQSQHEAKIALKSNKGKGVASLSQGTKRAIMGQEAPMEDASMPQPPPQRFGLCWIMEQE
ncbi:hypothetical protein HAX54_029962, partial [Datura stramonium]|nr:hypothetical protein [Datura stramonium]